MCGTWAANGLLTELDPLIEKTGFDIDNVVPALLEQGKLDGKTWSLPWTGATYELYYNNKMLAEAGFDAPPETWDEVMDYHKALTKSDDAGSFSQLGMLVSPGYAMAFTFGAELMNAERTEVTPVSDGFIEALEWCLDYYGRYDIEQIDLFKAGWGSFSTSESPMIKRQLAMRMDGEYRLGYIERNAPDALDDIDLVMQPYPAGREELKGSSETGAAHIYIPKGVKDVDLSWSFVEHLMSDECTLLWCYLFPCPSQNLSSLRDEKLRTMARGKMAVAMDIQEHPNLKVFPNSPVASEYMDALGEEVDLIIHGQKTPEEGLAAVRDRVQPQLDLYLAKRRVS